MWQLRCFLLLLAAIVTVHSDSTSRFQFHNQEGFSVHRLLRVLTTSDFEEFNRLFADASLLLPDADVSKSGLTLKIRKLVCKSISIDNMEFTHTVDSSSQLTAGLSVDPFTFGCTADYSYSFSFFRGSGRMAAQARNNRINAQVQFASPTTFAQEPPTKTQVSTCSSTLDIYDMTFRGGLVARIVDLFENAIDDVIEREIEKVVCEELTSVTDLLDKTLADFQTRLDPHLQAMPESLTNPVYEETKLLQVPSNVNLLNLKYTNETIGYWFEQALAEADSLLGDIVEDPQGGPDDLGINIMLRNRLLDDNGALSFDLSDLPAEMDFDPILFEGGDRLTESKITLNEVRIFGIDSLKSFNPLNMIGNFTVENELTWKYLDVEVYMTVVMEPSTSENSILENPKPVTITEDISVSFGINNVDVVASLMAAIDQDKLGRIELASILKSENIVDCLMSSLFAFNVSGLNVQLDSIDDPVLDGFVSAGVDRVITDGVQAAFVMYEDTFLKAAPRIFQEFIRDLLNTQVLGGVLEDRSCAPVTWEAKSESVDWRDLLAKPEQARALGGSGTKPYGDLAYTAYEMALSRFTEDGEDGTPGINEAIIQPMTLRQSGVEGRLAFPSDLVSFSQENITNKMLSNLVDRFEFRMFDGVIENLDTFSTPLSFLKVMKSPNTLENSFFLGSSPASGVLGAIGNVFNSHPLSLGTRVLLELEGKSPFKMSNELQFTASMSSVSLGATVEAFMNASTIATFPLRHVLNTDCWISTLIPSTTTKIVSSAVIEIMTAALFALQLDAQCVSCTSTGAQVLPELIDIVEDSGGLDILTVRAPSFLVSLVESDWFDSIIDTRIADSARFCPFQPEYEENAVRTNTAIGMPVFEPESIDTLLYTGLNGAWAGFIIFAENLRQQAIPVVDPLEEELSFETPAQGTLLNWTNLGQSTGLGSLADEALEQARSYLGKTNDKGRLEINALLQSLLDENGTLNVNLESQTFELDGLAVTIDSITVGGLDSFERFDVMRPIGALTLDNSIQLKSLTAELKVSVGYSDDLESIQQLTVTVAVHDVEATIALFAAFDVERLRQLPLGRILKVENIFPCLLSTTYSVKIAKFVLALGSFETVSVEGLMEETSASTTRILNATRQRYEETIVEAMPLLFEGAFKDLVSNYIEYFVDGANCREPMASKKSEFLDFRDLLLSSKDSIEYGGSGTSPYGNLFRKLYEVVEKEVLDIDPVTGESAFNEMLVQPFTQKQSGAAGQWLFEGDILDGGAKVDVGGLQADVSLRLYDAYVENLDSFGAPLSILDVVKGRPRHLNNTASIGVGKPLRLGGRFSIELIGSETTIRNDLDVSLSMKTATAVAAVMINVIESAFMNLPIEALGHWQCWLSLLPTPNLDERGVRREESEAPASLLSLDMSVEELKLNVSCIDCTGPLMPVFSELLSETRAIDDATDVANKALDFVSDLLEGDFLQVAIDRLVSDSKRQCPSSPEFDKDAVPRSYAPFDSPTSTDSIAFLVALAMTTIAIGVGLSLVVLAIRVFVRLRHRRFLKSLSNEKLALLSADQKKREEKVRRINESTTSLFRSRAIPAAVRFAVPIIILGNIAFFLSGHLSLGGSVTIMLTLAGQTYSADNFFDFSMASSAVEIWNAGGKELAMMILIFSGVWPYTKQLVSLVVWFTPPRLCSVTRRENIYLWLDCLGKWSIIDIFVLVMTLAAFRVSVKSPDVDFLPEDFYQLDLLVVPKWGLYANMIAQIISQISSHFIIHYHRRVVHQATLAVEENNQNPVADTVVWELQHDDSEDGSSLVTGVTNLPATPPGQTCKERLCDHAFARPHRGESEKVVPRAFIAPLMGVVSAAMVALCIAGCSVPSYSLDILGIVGILVESGQRFSDATSDYSVFNTVGLLLDQAAFTGKTGDYVGLGTLSALLVVTVLFVPVAQCIVLLYMWFGPMTQIFRKRLMIVVEVLSAWQYAEVYLISVIVASWQLGPVSEYMINAYCGSLSATFAQLVYYGVLKDEDAQCFRVNTSVSSGFYILAVAAALLALLNAFVTKAVRQFIRDNETTTNNLLVKVVDGTEEDDMVGVRKDIRPVPVLFSDTFRWLLTGTSSSMALDSVSLNAPFSTDLDEPEIDLSPVGGPLESINLDDTP